MKFWDTHAHLYLLNKPQEVIEDFGNQKIAGCVCPAVDYATSLEALNWAEQYPGIIGASIGIHPQYPEDRWDAISTLATHPHTWAIGETGLDYYHHHIPHEVQKIRFIDHIMLANAHQLPLIVHMRQAAEDTLALLKAYATCPIILHSFSETFEVAKQALDLGCYLSFSGIVTFKNAHMLREVLSKVPPSACLIETDTPYLTPEPYRGQSNEPKRVIEIARTLAQIFDCSLEDTADLLLANTQRVFPRIRSSETSS